MQAVGFAHREGSKIKESAWGIVGQHIIYLPAVCFEIGLTGGVFLIAGHLLRPPVVSGLPLFLVGALGAAEAEIFLSLQLQHAATADMVHIAAQSLDPAAKPLLDGVLAQQVVILVGTIKEKQAYVADLKAKFESAVSGCVVAYGGINVENDTKLRKELREAGVDYMVVKNTMLRLAVKGTSLETLAEQFKGDTAIAFAHEEDPMSAARILCKYQDGDKSKKFVVKAGFMEGKVMDAAETNAIAKLPNREGMLSMFAGALTSTLSGLAVAMQAYADKQEEPAA